MANKAGRWYYSGSYKENKNQGDMMMSKHSHAMENFSHFVVALIGATVIVGAVAWAFMASDDHGCGGGINCRTPAQMAQAHY